MKIIIVDDEKMIRIGIEQVIPWNEIGIDEVYTAGDAMEALDTIRRDKPQIMITDLNMPEVDGLSLIDQARGIVPNMRIIVLTGYERFDYARECLNLGVQDFLLKPIDEDVLIRTVRKQINSIRQEHSSDLARATLRRFQIEQSLQNYLTGKEDTYFIETLRPLMHAEGYQIALIGVGGNSMTESDQEYYLESMKNLCVSVTDAKNQGMTILDGTDRIAILFWLETREQNAERIADEVCDLLRNEYNARIRCAIGGVVDRLDQIRISYNDASLLLKEGAPDDRILIPHSTAKRRNLFYDVLLEMKKAMGENLDNTEYVMRIYDSFCQAVSAYNISEREIRTCCYELISSLYYRFLEHTGSQPDGRLEKYMISVSHATSRETIDLTRSSILELLDTKEEENVHEAITYAKSYILDHLDEDLSVGEIAGLLYLTPNYFSRLFKHDTGIGCNEFIVQERIKKAKNLLEITSLRTNRIAGMVGYKDTNYFSLAFKKNVGMSPTLYREQFRKKTEE